MGKLLLLFVPDTLLPLRAPLASAGVGGFFLLELQSHHRPRDHGPVDPLSRCVQFNPLSRCPEGGAALAETVQLWLGGARWGWVIWGIYRGRMQKLEVIKVWIMNGM